MLVLACWFALRKSLIGVVTISPPFGSVDACLLLSIPQSAKRSLPAYQEEKAHQNPYVRAYSRSPQDRHKAPTHPPPFPLSLHFTDMPPPVPKKISMTYRQRKGRESHISCINGICRRFSEEPILENPLPPLRWWSGLMVIWAAQGPMATWAAQAPDGDMGGASARW